jgi:hypothetical protein
MIGHPGIGALAVTLALAMGAAKAVGVSLFTLTSPAFTTGRTTMLSM